MIAPTSFFSDYGGHIRIYEETLALQALGGQVTIVTYYKGRDLAGLDIRRTPPLPWHTDYEVGSSRHKFAFDAYLGLTALRVAWQTPPAIIHGHMHEGALIGAMLARMWRVPLVFDFQGSLSGEMVDHGFLDPQGYPYRLARRLERFICHQPHAILTSSLRAQTLLTQDFAVPAGRIVPMPDCVDLRRFDPARCAPEAQAQLHRRWNLPADRPLVVYLGLLADYQGIPHLIEAAARLKQLGVAAHFLVMGYPNVERYQHLADALGVADGMTFTGKVHYDEAPLALSLGTVAVSAKLSATEGSGKVLNYMAMALPVAAYDTAVHREYLGTWGRYAPAGDVESLAQTLAQLVSDPAAGRQLGQGLRERARQLYSWESAARRMFTLYHLLRQGVDEPAAQMG